MAIVVTLMKSLMKACVQSLISPHPEELWGGEGPRTSYISVGQNFTDKDKCSAGDCIQMDTILFSYKTLKQPNRCLSS